MVKNVIIINLFLGLIFSSFVKSVYAENVDGCPYTDLNECVSFLSDKIKELNNQGKTLSSQIAVLNNQVRLTEARISATKKQISDLTLDIDTTTKKISSLQESLDTLIGILVNRIVATYESGSIQPFSLLLSSGDVSNFFSKYNYLKIVQAHDKRLIYETQQAKNDYANQKEIFETKKKKVESLRIQLESYTSQLAQEEKSKQGLLEVTQNDEGKYQQLLDEAQAQINAFKSFASSKGGASILPAQPSPDGWYYNQRDERWGKTAIGTSGEQIWDVGCLITSTAMVLKKHGVNVTPVDIASNRDYYLPPTAFMLRPWDGGKFSDLWGFNQSDIDSKLLVGEPVIIGLHAGVYGMHFVVLKSGAAGNYTMNDPWNGPDLKFSDYYSTSQVFQYGFYNGG